LWNFAEEYLIDGVRYTTRRRRHNGISVPTRIPVGTRIRFPIRWLKQQAEAKSIELDPRIHVDEASVLGDARLLERVFVNLLTNAEKYSPEGATVGVELTRAGDELHCCVFDTGYDISEADLGQLFGRYKRVQRAEHVSERGIGLGLAFVEATVTRHGGRIEVASEINKGSRFCVVLPAAPG
jgi:signal transduction histidine kinase